MRRALFLAIPLAFLSAACTYDNGDARRVLVDEGASGASSADGDASSADGGADGTNGACGAATPVQTWIDVDRELVVSPGEGAGLFIEYAAGGHWHLRTTCDTLKNNTPCAWDIIVTPEDGRSISNAVAEDLEAGTDALGTYPEYPRSYQLIAKTSGDLDGFTFDTEPQTAISVDALLDGACALPYFFWIGDGAVHTGSPTNPLELVPTPE
jgi:hypothetical protein